MSLQPNQASRKDGTSGSNRSAEAVRKDRGRVYSKYGGQGERRRTARRNWLGRVQRSVHDEMLTQDSEENRGPDLTKRSAGQTDGTTPI